jgi:diaminohydroxyphosphoribosylaminopyrimidine deaminase/5-amino-6-(5-phosphoribosylamino)uracil reductase
MLTEQHERFMRVALREARKGLGLTSPNPAVGAILVIRGRVVARGHHRQAGLPHAEIECLRNFGRLVPKDAILYITLEPCSTRGRTGACTGEIVKAGVKNVVIGSIDVNPQHQGRGVKLLRDAGLRVEVGVLASECAALNEAFNKWIVTGAPFIIAKCGMSLDGRLSRPPNELQWLTTPQARRHARALRAQVDAILVGAQTVRIDNPKLTVRNTGRSRQPFRVVLTRSGKLPDKAHVFTDRFAHRTVIYRKSSLQSVLRELGRKQITSVLIEGGGDILGQALDQRLIDKVQIYLGPIMSGGPIVAFGGCGSLSTQRAPRLERVSYQEIGQNVCVTGYPKYG